MRALDARRSGATGGRGARLRYHASGFRDPFGIEVDADGDVWLSANGNSDPGFLSPDLVYKKVPLGGQGDFPPSAFGYGPPHVVGTPIAPLADLGQSPSPTGMAFVPSGPDAGKLAVADCGASNDPAVGRDVILLDPHTGARALLVTGLNGRLLRLNMRATSEGGTAQGAQAPVTVDALPPTGSVKITTGSAPCDKAGNVSTGATASAVAR